MRDVLITQECQVKLCLCVAVSLMRVLLRVFRLFIHPVPQSSQLSLGIMRSDSSANRLAKLQTVHGPPEPPHRTKSLRSRVFVLVMKSRRRETLLFGCSCLERREINCSTPSGSLPGFHRRPRCERTPGPDQTFWGPQTPPKDFN